MRGCEPRTHPPSFLAAPSPRKAPPTPFWAGQAPPARHSPVYPSPSRKLVLRCLPSPCLAAPSRPPSPHPTPRLLIHCHGSQRRHLCQRGAGLGRRPAPPPAGPLGPTPQGVWTALLYLQQLKVTFLPGLSCKHSSSSFKTARFPCKCLRLSPAPLYLKISPCVGVGEGPTSLPPASAVTEAAHHTGEAPPQHTHTAGTRRLQGPLPGTLTLRRVWPPPPWEPQLCPL